MLFDFSKIMSEEDVHYKLDEIRTETMFASREECLHIICEVLYAYGVDKGHLNKSAVDYILSMYRDKASDEDLERIAALCLNINAVKQREEEFNNAHNENENGN